VLLAHHETNPAGAVFAPSGKTVDATGSPPPERRHSECVSETLPAVSREPLRLSWRSVRAPQLSRLRLPIGSPSFLSCFRYALPGGWTHGAATSGLFRRWFCYLLAPRSPPSLHLLGDAPPASGTDTAATARLDCLCLGSEACGVNSTIKGRKGRNCLIDAVTLDPKFMQNFDSSEEFMGEFRFR
jgi:hypothetical protein